MPVKSAIYWVVTPRCSGNARHFGGRSGRLLLADGMLGLVFVFEDGKGMFLRNFGAFSELLDVTNQKTSVFTVTAIKTSNPTY
jgi:hypothetical protein